MLLNCMYNLPLHKEKLSERGGKIAVNEIPIVSTIKL